MKFIKINEHSYRRATLLEEITDLMARHPLSLALPVLLLAAVLAALIL